MKLLSSLIALSLMTAACTNPKLPDPTIQLAPPPAPLMVPPEKMKPIPKDEAIDGRK